MKRLRSNPIAIALILAVILFVIGGIVQPDFASYGQAMNILRLAAFLGIVAAGQTLVIISYQQASWETWLLNRTFSYSKAFAPRVPKHHCGFQMANWSYTAPSMPFSP